MGDITIIYAGNEIEFIQGIITNQKKDYAYINRVLRLEGRKKLFRYITGYGLIYIIAVLIGLGVYISNSDMVFAGIIGALYCYGVVCILDDLYISYQTKIVHIRNIVESLSIGNIMGWLVFVPWLSLRYICTMIVYIPLDSLYRVIIGIIKKVKV